MLPIVVGGLLVVALVGLVLCWREQTLQDRQFNRMLDIHCEVIEHLEIAANPDAWIAQKAEERRRERRAEEHVKESEALKQDSAEERGGVW